MSKTIKLRTKVNNGVAEIRMLLRHPMEVGRRLRNGDRIAPHFISTLSCEHNGKIVLQSHWGAGISKNPYVAFTITEAAHGDRLRISWTDNQGANDSLEAEL